MAEPDINAERHTAARSISSGNRDELVKFSLDLANKFGGRPVSKELREEESKSTVLTQAERLLQLKIIEYSRGVLRMPEADRTAGTLRLTTALFLLERTKAIRDAALKDNKLGLFSLYVSLRDDVCGLLGPSYYGSTFKDIAGAYLDIEPSIIAASKLCGFMRPPELVNIPDMYKMALGKRVEAALLPAGSARES